MTIPEKSKHFRSGRAFTLFEILLALGIAAVILGVTVPFLAESLGRSASDEATDALAQAAQATRAAAIDKGEARRLTVFEGGLKPDLAGLPAAELAAGWKLEIQRTGDSKFRKPAKREVWEFNSAGICEPVMFRLSNGRETTTVLFDPLTALVIPDE
jgi:type II secretory pathway pseudopilin PulG